MVTQGYGKERRQGTTPTLSDLGSRSSTGPFLGEEKPALPWELRSWPESSSSLSALAQVPQACPDPLGGGVVPVDRGASPP